VALLLVLAIVVPRSAQAQTLQILYEFTGSGDGANPVAGLVRDTAGNLYGTTQSGGAHGLGAVFKLDTANHETVLHSFSGSDGSTPVAGLIRDALGNFYGTTELGGAHSYGTVFKLDTENHETVLHNFGVQPDGIAPLGDLVRDAAGNLYGTTVNGGGSTPNAGTIFKVDAAGHETVLHNFTGPPDGASPAAGLVEDASGNFFFGTTESGGIAPGETYGTVFRVDATGHETVLYSFNLTDGGQPQGGLVRDSSGNLYGTTIEGGGNGTVFKVNPAGEATVLHNFLGTGDGAAPTGRLVRDSAGNLYGTTVGGGTGICNSYDARRKRWENIGCGTIFKVDPSGLETVLHSFTGLANGDGAWPRGGLVLDSSGNLYGTTANGGTGSCNVNGQNVGCGTVFKFIP